MFNKTRSTESLSAQDFSLHTENLFNYSEAQIMYRYVYSTERTSICGVQDDGIQYEIKMWLFKSIETKALAIVYVKDCVGWLVLPAKFCCSGNQYCSLCWSFQQGTSTQSTDTLTYTHTQIYKPVNMCIHYMHHIYANICTQSYMCAHTYTPQAQVYINMLHNHAHKGYCFFTFVLF